MIVQIERNSRIRRISYDGTVKGMLTKLKIGSEEALVVRDGALLTPTDKVKDTDKLQVLSVVSGG